MLRRLILDVLKPHRPSNIDIATELCKIKGVDGVHIITYNKETEVESVRITIEGKKLNFNRIEKILKKMGASIQSVDAVAAGRKIITELQR